MTASNIPSEGILAATRHSSGLAMSSVRMPEMVTNLKTDVSTKRTLKSNAGVTVTIGDKLQMLKQKPAADHNKNTYNNRQSDVLFVYNSKGDLRIRFMDSVNKLIYQIPSEFLARMSDLMIHPKTSVNTRE